MFWSLEEQVEDLFHLPSYPQQKQSKIIVACIALHNFIRQSQLPDIDFDKCDQDENYVPLPMPTTTTNDSTNEMDSAAMNQFRAWVADGLWSLKQQWYEQVLFAYVISVISVVMYSFLFWLLSTSANRLYEVLWTSVISVVTIL